MSESNAMARVIIVGGGAVGLACAWELARLDLEVVVVDAGRIGGGASSGNAGWICPTLVSPLRANGLVVRPSIALLPWLVRFAFNARRSRYEACVRELQALDRETMALYDAYLAAGVRLELHRRGLVIAARTPDDLVPYRRLAQTLVHDVRDATADVEPALAPSLHLLHAEVDGHVRPESLTAGLAASLAELGATLHEEHPVATIERRGREWVAGELTADAVVVAAGVDSARLLRPHGVRVPLVGVRGYSVDTEGEGEPPAHALYLAEPKLALSPFGATVRIAGVLELGGRPGSPDLAAAALPYLGRWRPTGGTAVWSGVRPMTPDGLPRIGPVGDGLHVATGHGMFGITLAPATARKLARSWTG